MIPRDLPGYVERGGRQVWRPPYWAEKTTIFGFVLPCDRAAVDLILQRDLVEPAGGAVDYRCAQSRMLVMFAAIEKLTSKEEPDSLRGFVREEEVSICCLAADVRADGRLVWYLPYVFVDPAQAAISGREVYGYPKQVGELNGKLPGALREEEKTSAVSASAIDPYGVGQAATPKEMISARRVKVSQAIAVGADVCDVLKEQLREGLEVNDELPSGPGPDPGAAITPAESPPPLPGSTPAWAMRRVLNTLSGGGIGDMPGALIEAMFDDPTLVFLKQLRDASCPTKACYQSIVEAPLVVDAMTADYKQLAASDFKITIKDWASHPIATELGVLADTEIEPEIAFEAKVDFEIGLGREVWRALP